MRLPARRQPPQGDGAAGLYKSVPEQIVSVMTARLPPPPFSLSSFRTSVRAGRPRPLFAVFLRLRVHRGLALVLRLEQRCPFQWEIAHGRAGGDRKAAVCQRVDPRAEAKSQQIAAEDFRLRRDVPQLRLTSPQIRGKLCCRIPLVLQDEFNVPAGNFQPRGLVHLLFVQRPVILIVKRLVLHNRTPAAAQRSRTIFRFANAGGFFRNSAALPS